MSEILLVEDDEALRDLLDEWLTFEGYGVTSCSSGSEALDHLKRGTFDIVLLDWHLTDVGGIEVLKQYRAGGGTTPILLLTGSTAPEQKQVALDAGANSYMRKPCNLVELAKTVARLVASNGKE